MASTLQSSRSPKAEAPGPQHIPELISLHPVPLWKGRDSPAALGGPGDPSESSLPSSTLCSHPTLCQHAQHYSPFVSTCVLIFRFVGLRSLTMSLLTWATLFFFLITGLMLSFTALGTWMHLINIKHSFKMFIIKPQFTSSLPYNFHSDGLFIGFAIWFP